LGGLFLMNKKFYITTPIYYANGSPHVGHFITTTAADVIARLYRLILGKSNVFFTTGLDEHGTTVEQAAKKEGYILKTFQKYVDKRAIEWEKAFKQTNISYDYFARTTNSKHEDFARQFIQKLIHNNDVYKSKYYGKYCNGCEKFLTLSDLNEKGHCPLHRPDQVVKIEEENYFFKLSKYTPTVKKLIAENKIKIIPEGKRAEILSRLETKIEDISISRPKEKVAWGIEFPGDKNQTIYVWVEALLNYLSSLEINGNKEFWLNTYHFLGKDISWFHNVIWPALLLSAKHQLFKGTFVHSFVIIAGEKISKSKGNIITPKELIDKFGVDGARYVILSNFPYINDSDITWARLTKKYNADLANGLGNLVSRVAKLCEKSGYNFLTQGVTSFDESVQKYLNEFRFDLALDVIWNKISNQDKGINVTKPWELKNRKLKEILKSLVSELKIIAFNLRPFLPETSNRIEEIFKGPEIKSGEILFPRLK